MAIDQALFAKTSQDVPGDQPRKDFFLMKSKILARKQLGCRRPEMFFFLILSAPKATRQPTQGCAVGRTKRVTRISALPIFDVPRSQETKPALTSVQSE